MLRKVQSASVSHQQAAKWPLMKSSSSESGILPPKPCGPPENGDLHAPPPPFDFTETLTTATEIRDRLKDNKWMEYFM